jgi:glycosyltransferase involved in cell wall biosynthesis
MSDRLTFRSSRGRTLVAYGDPALLTKDRMTEFGDRIDTDPRIVSLSLAPSPHLTHQWLRATAPAGPLIVIAEDAADLVGPLPDPAEVASTIAVWSRRASERGLWHDWWLTDDRDVAKAEPLLTPAEMDSLETRDPAASHYSADHVRPLEVDGLTIAVDVSRLGPYETGAQVLATAGIGALSKDPRIVAIKLIGLRELPRYAVHLADLPNVRLASPDEPVARADVVWYPNGIGSRNELSDARRLGRRTVTTYLDLIAYDIPSYHRSMHAWGTYRALQRHAALSVDGITPISADLAQRLVQEVPRLERDRVRPLPPGLDHIAITSVVDRPGDDLIATAKEIGDKPFIAVLGNDFQHKNRDFAIAVWQQVLAAGHSCDLVLAGLHVGAGSSREREQARLAEHVGLRGKIHTVGHLTSDSRAWLLRHSSVVLYPSSGEGFGFVPYEAAALDTPATFTDFGPLREIAQVEDLPKQWSIDAFAEDVARLLSDPNAARRRIDQLRRAVATHTWAGFAGGLIDFFQQMLATPTVLTSTVTGTAGDAAELSAVRSSSAWRPSDPLRMIVRKLRRR